MNHHQRTSFAKHIVSSLYNTIAGKKITNLVWSFKKDTNYTRESAAIYVADMLLDEEAYIYVYDPKVSAKQIHLDLNNLNSREKSLNTRNLNVEESPYDASKNSHAIAILTEWDEFREYDWEKIYKSMKKPAFIFDGRNILDKTKLEKIGFIYKAIGKQ